MKDFTEAEQKILAEAISCTIASPETIVQLIRAVDYILANNISGSFVECGVYRGGNALTMIRTLQNANVSDRDMWLYDTFDGMPKPEDIDVEFGVGPAHVLWSQKNGHDHGSDWVRATLDDARAIVIPTGYPPERIKFVQGMVEQTIPDNAPDQIALLRLDTDFYRSTKHELTHLFPRLARGGILIIDDYGAFQGSKSATDEYFREQNIPIFLGRCDAHVRIAVKQ